ncbi:MAG: hypothetical protein KDA93_23400 [Planctomycetaceae bacterium]|nr:hypothetical protein [Planctomycetaceae bacterium]
MAYRQVRDVVDEILRAHEQMGRVLEHAQHESVSFDQDTQPILEELDREQRELQSILSRYGDKGEKALLDTWLQYVPDAEVQKSVASFEVTPQMSIHHLVRKKLEFDQALIALLKQLARGTSVPRVQEFFQTLLEYTQTQTSQQVWSMREVHETEKTPN